MTGRLTIEDRFAVDDLLARYCWFVDEGQTDEWVALWTEDGAFSGSTTMPLKGHEALRQVPPRALGRGARHLLSNVVTEYGVNKDEVIVRAYSLVTNWLGGGRFNCMALVFYTLVRDGEGWLIKSNQIRRIMADEGDTIGFPEGFPYPADQPTRFPPI